MKVLRNIDELRQWRQTSGCDTRRLGFVPTMGNLHAGHLALVDHARRRAEVVIVSMFVNPLQFEDAEDLARYPRTEEQDLEQLRRAGVTAVFLPTEAELYPGGQRDIVRVDVGRLGERFEGAARPGHFTGVATVVAKLFNLVRPDVAVFGEKDAQQVMVVRRLIADLDFPVELAIESTHREADGLASSSRNRFLDAKQRRQAAAIYQALTHAAESLITGEAVSTTLERARHWLDRQGLDTDYLVYVDDLHFEKKTRLVTRGRLLVAARLGGVRLIDNLAVHSPPLTRRTSER